MQELVPMKGFDLCLNIPNALASPTIDPYAWWKASFAMEILEEVVLFRPPVTEPEFESF